MTRSEVETMGKAVTFFHDMSICVTHNMLCLKYAWGKMSPYYSCSHRALKKRGWGAKKIDFFFCEMNLRNGGTVWHLYLWLLHSCCWCHLWNHNGWSWQCAKGSNVLHLIFRKRKKISRLFIYCNASFMNMYEQLSMLSPWAELHTCM